MEAAKPTPEPNLVQKLAGVMADVKHVPKNGRNDFHKYDYATEADIADAVRDGTREPRGVAAPLLSERTLSAPDDEQPHGLQERARVLRPGLDPVEGH